MPELTVRKQAQLTGHNTSVFALGRGPGADGFFSGAGDGWIVRWGLKEPEVGRLAARVDTQIFSLLYLPEWDRVIAGDMNGGLHWIQLGEPEKTRNIAHHQKGVFDILRIGPYVYTAGGQGLLTRWDAASGRSLESIQLSNQSLRCLAYCPERGELAAGASDHAIYFLGAETLELRHRLAKAHDNSVFTLHYTPGGAHLLSGGRDAMLKAWALGNTPELLSAQAAHWYTINSIAFHPEGRWFATGSRDRSIKLWNPQTFELLKVLDASRDGGHVNSVNRLFWHPYHNSLISASDDRTMIVWEVEGAP
ncbi:MAG: WD40 repeat domain-containing protein [Lewinellaceae bacterium]|nr:WD40 repeat domain-containing protein [Lewinellaceae bacterium]